MKHLWILALIATTLIGCSSAKEKAEEATQDYLKDYSSNYTQGELEAFNQELSNAITNKENYKLSDLIDIKAMFFRGFEKVGQGEQFVNKVDAILGKANFAQEFIGNMQSSFEYIDFIQVEPAEDDMSLLTYRGFSIEGGINYIKFLVAKKGDKLKAIDIFVVMTGEYLGETLFQLMGQMLGSKTMSSDAATLSQAKNLFQMGQPDQALSILQSIPSDSPMRNTKAYKVFELSIIGSTDDWKGYTSALTSYRESYPNDASADLVSVDYYLMNNDYENCLKSLANLQEQFPSDGALDYMLGTVHYLKGNCDQATSKFEESKKAFPNESSIDDMIMAITINCGEEVDMQELMEME